MTEKKTTSALVVILLVWAGLAHAQAQSVHESEHQLKAAVIYSFIKFTDWPEAIFSDGNEIVIGILSNSPLAKSFDPVKDKTLKDKTLVVKDLGTFEQLNKDRSGSNNVARTLHACHVLFICDSERAYLKDILAVIADHNVLTVGESAGFLEAGGMINFVPGAEKPVFEVNLTACEKENLKMSSRVLRLAVRIIKKEDQPQDANQ